MATKTASKSGKTANKTARKLVKKLHPATKICMVLFLVLGIVGGAVTCMILGKNDAFELRGSKSYSFDLGEEGATFLYTEEGAEARCFGINAEGKVNAETVLEKNEAGQYVVPLDKEGVYTIVYTVDAYKFNGKLSGEQIKRIRTFTVTATEEDGRYED